VRIAKKTGAIVVRTDAASGFEAVAKERTFNLVPGFECAAVVVAFGQILPREILEAPRLGCFNLHGSLLPRWRGAAPIQRAIMAGDPISGVQARAVPRPRCPRSWSRSTPELKALGTSLKGSEPSRSRNEPG